MRANEMTPGAWKTWLMIGATGFGGRAGWQVDCSPARSSSFPAAGGREAGRAGRPANRETFHPFAGGGQPATAPKPADAPQARDRSPIHHVLVTACSARLSSCSLIPRTTDSDSSRLVRTFAWSQACLRLEPRQFRGPLLENFVHSTFHGGNDGHSKCPLKGYAMFYSTLSPQLQSGILCR
jgi:hypothetical protein